MKKKQAGKATVLLIIAVAVILLGAGAFMYGIQGLKTASLTDSSDTGFVIESISATNIISNDQELASANFIVSAVANGGGQSVIGYFADDIQQKFANLIVKYPLRIEIGSIIETLDYPIENQGSLYGWTYSYTDAPNGWTGAKCDTDPNVVYCLPINTDRWGLGLDRVINIKKAPLGNYGRFNDPNTNIKGKITLTINGIPITKEISNQLQSAEFYSATGEWIARANWVGNLVTGTGKPSESLYIATYTVANGKWRVAPYSSYDNYLVSLGSTDAKLLAIKNGLPPNFQNIGYTWTSGYKEPIEFCGDSACNNVINILTAHNGAVGTMLSKDVAIGYDSATVGAASSQQSDSNSVTVTLTNRRISNPKFVFEVKAKSLGVYIPVGKPQIISIDSKEFASGDSNGIATATIKNVGEATGAFVVTFTESTNTFYQAGNPQKITLEPGQTGTATVHIAHGSSAQAESKTARMRVYDYNKPSNYNEKDFIISMTAPKKCIPGNVRAEGEVVWTCKADGSGEEITLDCTNKGLDYANGKYSCKVGDTKGTPTPTPPGTNQTKKSAGTVLNWYETPQAGILAILIILTAAIGLIRFRRTK